MQILLQNDITIDIGDTHGIIHINFLNRFMNVSSGRNTNGIQIPIFPESSVEEIMKSCGRSMAEFIINQINTNTEVKNLMSTWRFNERLLRKDKE